MLLWLVWLLTGLAGLAGSAGLGVGLGGWFVAEDVQVQGGQFGRRLHAELVDQAFPGLLVDLQGSAAPPGGVQRAHQARGQRLAHRVGDDQTLELGDQRRGVPGAQVGIDALLDGGQPHLVEPGDRGLAEVGVGHVGQGWAAPQGERLAEGLAGGGRVVPQLGATGGHQVLEPDDVGRARVNLQLVSGRTGFDHRLGQGAAQPGHQGLQRVARAGRHLLRPQAVDQLAGRDELAGVQGQHDQQRAQPGPGNLDDLPRVAVGADLQRPEQRDVHRLNCARTGGDAWRTTGV